MRSQTADKRTLSELRSAGESRCEICQNYRKDNGLGGQCSHPEINRWVTAVRDAATNLEDMAQGNRESGNA